MNDILNNIDSLLKYISFTFLIYCTLTYGYKLIEKKKYSQPSKINTCGSTFKNTKNKKAWELIKESKCENISVGNAFISKKHCNFFENKGEATSRDIEELIAKVRSAVFKKTGIKLDLELKIVGEDR